MNTTPLRSRGRRVVAFTTGIVAAVTLVGSATVATAATPMHRFGADGVETAGPDTALETRTILDGWVTFATAPGWEVLVEADVVEPIRADFDRPAYEPSLAGVETLVQLERTDGRALITLAREPAYLDTPDIDAWTGAIVGDLVGPEWTPLGDEVIEAAHGRIRRLLFRSDLGDEWMIATSAFGDQRMVVIAALAGDLETDEQLEAVGLISAIELDPAAELDPLLQFHQGIAWLDVDGQRVVEVGIPVPSNWHTLETADGLHYTSPDETASVTVEFVPVGGLAKAEAVMADVLDDVLAERDDRPPVAQMMEGPIGATNVVAARLAPDDSSDPLSGSSYVIVGATEHALAVIQIDDVAPEPDFALIGAIFERVQIGTR